MKTRTLSLFTPLVTLLPALVSCGADGAAGADLLGSATFEIGVVPPGALCLQVTGTGAATFNVTAAVAAGASSTAVAVGRLPVGTMTVTANVFNAACTSLAGQTPTWIADAQVLTLRAGATSTLALTFRPNNPVVAGLNFVPNIADIGASFQGTGLVLADGTTRLAGDWFGLPASTVLSNTTPSLVGVAQLTTSSTAEHACARSTTGTVSCWGSNSHGQLGSSVAVGSSSSTPVVVPGAVNALQVAVGDGHSCALVSDGGLYCWGSNARGQLGIGSATTSTSVPTRLVAVSSRVFDRLVAGDFFTCASSTNEVYCWGQNSSGQLGDGTTTDRTTPREITNLRATVSFSAGDSHACAVRADGTVRCWGSNSSGRLGDGTTGGSRNQPTLVVGVNDAVEVAAGMEHTCIRHRSGGVSCFGANSLGQLGDGSGDTRSVATTVPGISGAKKLVASAFHTCVLQENQEVRCWGHNDEGQLSDNTLVRRYAPVTATVQ